SRAARRRPSHARRRRRCAQAAGSCSRPPRVPGSGSGACSTSWVTTTSRSPRTWPEGTASSRASGGTAGCDRNTSVAAPTTRYARSGDVHLAYQVIGDGPRDVVLSLDWASHLEVLWEQPFVQELLTALARFSRVLWFDMRGVGLSDALGPPAAPEDWIDDVAAVMDAA